MQENRRGDLEIFPRPFSRTNESEKKKLIRAGGKKEAVRMASKFFPTAQVLFLTGKGSISTQIFILNYTKNK